MNPVAVKVEIRFDGTSWVDVSADVVLASGLSISRGRDSETGDAISVGTCSFTLQNDAGEYSPDLPASSHYPNVVEGVHLRVSALADGVYRPRFYGTVQSWDTGPLDETGAQATCLVTAADSLGSFPSYTFRQATDEIIKPLMGSTGVSWSLSDSAGPASPLVGPTLLAASVDSGWGEGGRVPLDDLPYPLFTSGSGGMTLTPIGLTVHRYGWKVRAVISSEPTAACSIIKFLTDAGDATLAWSGSAFTLTGGFSVTPTSWPLVVEVASASFASNLTRLAVAGADGVVTSDSDTIQYTKLQSFKVNPTLSGGATWSLGHLCYQSAIASVITDASLTAFAEPVLGARVPATDTAVNLLATLSGAPAVSGAPVGAAAVPPLVDRDAADAIGALVTGMGARLVDNLDGTLRWVAFDDGTAAVAIPSGLIDPTVRWRTDSAGWVSEETVTWPDGTSYTARRDDGKRQSGSIEGVHATRLQDRSYADWLVNTASRGARLPVAPFNVASLTEAQKVTLCSVDPADRVSFTGLPSHMPSALTCICEGLDETLTDASWDITLKLSPDVYSRLFILDDPVAGLLDSTHLLAP